MASDFDDLRGKEEMSDRIERLANDILDIIQAECVKKKASDVELFVAMKYLMVRIQNVLGAERVKQLEKSFVIVNYKEDNVC